MWPQFIQLISAGIEREHWHFRYYPPFPTIGAVSILGSIIMKNTYLCFYINMVLLTHHLQDLKWAFSPGMTDGFIQSRLHLQSSSS